MVGWGELVAAFAVFLLSHAIPARPPIRRRLVGLLGERLYLLLYAALSIGLLAWLIVAAGRAPYLELWEPAPWQRWLPNLALPASCLLGAFGAGAANPFSIAGAPGKPFDPERPGIAGVTRHPLLWAFVLWAGAHLIPNGDLAHVILFGTFLLFALAGMAALERRKRRQLGEAEWRRLAEHTSLLPLAALVAGRWRPAPGGFPLWRLTLAFGLYALLLGGHQAVIGVSPLP